MANNTGPPIEMPEFTLENWWPMEPAKGPPLPEFLGITWPWYKEEEPPLANLFGIVTDADTGAPLPGVLVTINGLTTMTSALGEYTFIDLTAGSYTTKFEKDSYETVIR